MTSVIFTEPNINKFIYSIDNNEIEYEEPIYSTNNNSYYILTNTSKIPYYFDVIKTDNTTEMNIFMVGGGECNGGSGGATLYSKFFIEPSDKIKMEIGKGGYINDIKEEIKQGLKLKIYEYDPRVLYSKSIFSFENKFLLNMHEEDLTSRKFNLLMNDKITSLSDINTVINNYKNKDCIYEISGFIIANDDDLTRITININTENEGIVYIWNDNDVITNNNLHLYETFNKNNYLKVKKSNETFTKIIDKNKKYYIKIILFNTPNEIKINTDINKYNYNDYQIETIAPTSTIIKNINTDKIIMSANGGQSNKNEGVYLPNEFSDLTNRNIYKNKFGYSANFNNNQIPVKNTGGGGITNSYKNNIINKKINLKELSGSDGIIIIKIFRKNRQTMIETFENQNQDKTIVDKYNTNIRTIYKTNIIDLKNSNTIINIVSPNTNKEYYKKILKTLGILYSNLFLSLPYYIDLLKDLERRRPNIKIKIRIINDININEFIEMNKNKIPVEYNYYLNEFIFKIPDFNFFTKEEINSNFNNYEYNYSSANDFNTFLNTNTNIDKDYYKKFILNEINNLIKPTNIMLFIENINFNYFKYLLATLNYIYFYENLYQYMMDPRINKDAVVDKLRTGIKLINDLNNITYDNLQFDNRDIKNIKRTEYLEQQKELNNKHLEIVKKLTESNNKINLIKNNGNYTEINYTYNYVYYFLFILICVIFIFFYTSFEQKLQPFVLIILLILIAMIIIFIIVKAYKDIDFYEGFTGEAGAGADADADAGAGADAGAVVENGIIINTSMFKAPYYLYLGDKASINNYVELNLSKDIIVNIYLYGTPHKTITNGISEYYQPNIDIYNNLYLSKNYRYRIYNHKIVKINANDTTNTEILMYSLPTSIDNTTTARPYLNIYDCLYNQHHICNNTPIKTQQLLNMKNIYNENGIITNIRNEITSDIQELPGVIIKREDYDFNGYSKYSYDYIKVNVLNKPFITVKIMSNTIETVQYIEDAIHEYKTKIEILETNIRIYLLNKNSKHMIMYNKSFLNERNNIYSKKIDLNTNKYNVYFQAINIRNLELLYNFYIHLCMFLFIALVFICLLLLYYLPNYSIIIIIISFIIGLIIFIIILYNLLRRQRIYTNKYYFSKPDKYV